MSELSPKKTSKTRQNQTNPSTKSSKRKFHKSQKEEARAESADLLLNLTLATNLRTDQKIEIARLQLESERLEVEKVKSLTDQRFWVKNFGASITAIISLAAVLVSVSQIWVANIQKDKEIEVARTQKAKELETIVVQQERAWKLEMAKFVIDHKDKLLGKDKAQFDLMTKVMLTTFPYEYSSEIIGRLDAVTDSQEVKQKLQNIRTTILPKIKENRDSEKAIIIKDAAGNRVNLSIDSLDSLTRMYGAFSVATPSPSITPTASPHDSCRCPQPFAGGIECWGRDDMAVCKITDGKCVTRCVNARSSSY